ncbi:MAG: phenylalanine--tRNA ligase subunit beta [Rickettsiales bacterium]
MQFSISLLKQYLDTSKTDEQIIAKFNDLGLEVEKVLNYKELFKNIVIAEIIEVKQHLNAANLSICQVNDGAEILQIICGCSSVKAGMQVILAKIGAFIPRDEFYIKKSKIRGEYSNGMLCSLSELGLEENSEFIFNVSQYASQKTSKDKNNINQNENKIFNHENNNENNDYNVHTIPLNGTEIASYLELDTIIELSITPNRGDLMSVYGIARELEVAGYGKLLPIKNNFLIKDTNLFELNSKDNIAKTLIQKHNNQYYDICYFVKINNVDNTKAYSTFSKHLKNLGLKVISPLVDITNYIANMLGNPTHVYSANSINGNLRVDQINDENQQKFKGLDDNEYELKSGDIVIMDNANQVVGLAGIMGGQNSMMHINDSEIIFELGIFNSTQITKTGQRLNLFSNARQKFERGVSSCNVDAILENAINMILNLCGGKVESIICYKNNQIIESSSIEIKLSQINNYIGTKLDADKVEEILNNLKCQILNIRHLESNIAKEQTLSNQISNQNLENNTTKEQILNNNNLKVTNENITVFDNAIFTIKLPNYRFDLATQQDIIGEIARIYGYSNIIPIKPNIQNSIVSQNEYDYYLALSTLGFDQIIGWSFISKEKYNKYINYNDKLEIQNPISNNMNFLRPSAIFSLLSTIQENISKNLSNNLAFFEVGPVFSVPLDNKLQIQKNSKSNQNIQNLEILEETKLSGIKQLNSNLYNQNITIHDVLADLIAIVPGIHFEQILDDKAPLYFNPMSVAKILFGKKELGFVGRIKSDLLEIFDLKDEFCYFELDYAKLKTSQIKYENIKDHPIIIRNFSFKVENNFSIQSKIQFENEVRNFEMIDKDKKIKIVKDIQIFDLFKDKEGKYLAFKIWLQHSEKTLNDAEIHSFQDFVIQKAKIFNIILKRDL